MELSMYSTEKYRSIVHTWKGRYHAARPESHGTACEQPQSANKGRLEWLSSTSTQDPVTDQGRRSQIPHPIGAVESERPSRRKVENVFNLGV